MSEINFNRDASGDRLGEYVFSDPAVSLEGLKEFAATEGKAWTDVGLMTRFVLEHERPWREAVEENQRRIHEELHPLFEWLRTRILEREREEIVESIPWAD